MPSKTIIEPFRIKSVEPIRWTTREQREELLRAAHYNLFLLPADDVLIDLLTDSGTGAMSTHQWAAIMQGDESYAGSRSFDRFRDSVQGHLRLPSRDSHAPGTCGGANPVQRCCKKGDVVPNNTHFDTTRANIEFIGAEAVDLPIAEARQPAKWHPFKGNMDVAALEELIGARRTGTHSAGDDHDHQQLRRRSAGFDGERSGCKRCLPQARHPALLRRLPLCRERLFHQAARAGYADKTPKQIAQEMFALGDGCTMSAKKDGMANIGGFLCTNDDVLAAQEKDLLILTEGYPTYGGLAGRDLEAIAVGMQESLEEDYLRYRIASTAYLGDHIAEQGVPIIQPPGGHAIYLDARAFLPHIPLDQFPGVALAAELYLEGGIRSVEIGTLMFGAAAHDGSGATGDSAPRLHAEPYGLRDRGRVCSLATARADPWHEANLSSAISTSLHGLP